MAMIDKKELRVGNYVGKEGSKVIKIVHEIGYSNLQCSISSWAHSDAESYDDLIGVPLTVDILKKFGFEPYEYELKEWRQTFAGRVTFALTEQVYTNGEPWFDLKIEMNVACGFDGVLINPATLHHLQNLIYDLTFEELKPVSIVKP